MLRMNNYLACLVLLFATNCFAQQFPMFTKTIPEDRKFLFSEFQWKTSDKKLTDFLSDKRVGITNMLEPTKGTPGSYYA